MKKNFRSKILLAFFLFSGVGVVAIASSPTDYFKSVTTGNWNTPATWESSSTLGGSYSVATLAPTSASMGITIQSGDIVTLTDTRLIDQVTVLGTLIVRPNVYIQLNAGEGTDLIIAEGGKMILESDATGAAGIDDLTKYGNATIEQHNNVTQKRYFNAKRSWRLITAPLRSSVNDVSIFESWQNNGVYEPGKGFFVSAPVGGAAEGIDATRKYSLKGFDIASQLVLTDIGNTKTTPLFTTEATVANNSYFVFVRGDRDPANLTIPNTNTTTISATGELQTGQQIFSSVPGTLNELALVGNPYAALVDFQMVERSNVLDRFWAWDPTLAEVGAYVLVDRPEGQTLYSVSVPQSSQTSVIQINQAVFVQSLGPSASITFNENAKTTVGNSAAVFRTNDKQETSFTSNLFAVYADNSTKLFDGNKVMFDDDYSANVDRLDAPKLSNFNENLGLVRNGVTLAMEKRATITDADTLFLKLWNTTQRSYQLQFEAANFSPSIVAYLEDAYLKTATPLKLDEPSIVSFSVTADPESANENRFMVVFKAVGVLPLNFTTIRAYEQRAGINVDWNLATESNVKHYEVEKSANGREFTQLAKFAARTNNSTAASYSYIDANPFQGNNYYRIKATENTGTIKYSGVVKVSKGNVKGDIAVYPIPVKNKVLNLQLNNQPKGSYTVKVVNGIGQQVFTKVITHIGGSSTQTIQLSSVIANGIYQLQVTNGKTSKTQQFIVE